jgi:Spy/CpxP family protein refolding chaperone
MFLRGLDLTDTQRQQVKAILDENRPQDPPKNFELEQQLHAAIINGDSGSVESIKGQLKDLHAQQLDQQVAVFQKIVPILTAEQKKQLLEQQPGPGRGRGRAQK